MRRASLLTPLLALLTACSATPTDTPDHAVEHASADTAGTQVGTSTAALAAPSLSDPRCGNGTGVQPLAAWPMRGGCPTHAAVAQVHGTAQGTRNWIRDWLLLAPGASPAIGADGAVIAGTTTGVAAVDQATGADRWGAFVFLGVRTTPAVARDGTVYFGSDLNYLHALDPVTHAEKWSYDSGAMITSSPVVGADGTVYFGNLAGSLFAVRASGTLKWKFNTGSAVESSPAIGPDGTIYFGSNNGRVYALDQNGVQKWSRSGLTAVRSSPAVHNGTVYVGSDANKLHALDVANGNIRWEKDLGADVRSSPAVGSTGNVYVGSLNGKLYAFSPAGTQLWTYTAGGPIYSSPTIDVDGRIYFGSDDKKLHGLNGATGARLFSYTTSSAVRSNPALDSSGRVHFGDEGGVLHSVGLGSAADRISVDPAVALADPVNIDSDTGEEEPLSGMVDSEGEDFMFTSHELLLGGTATELNTFVSRYGGTVQQTIDLRAETTDPTYNAYVIRIDPARAPDPATIPANMRLADPNGEADSLRVSDALGLSLISTWADARARGLQVEVDFAGGVTSIASGVTIDGNVTPFQSGKGVEQAPGLHDWTRGAGRWSTNAFDWVHFAKANTTQTIGVPQAWQRLLNAGKLSRSVRVGFIDSGFSQDAAVKAEYPDLPLSAPQTQPFGRNGTGTNAWHGTSMIQIGFGRADNQIGAAGPGEAVLSKLVILRFSKSVSVANYVKSLMQMKSSGVDIINASIQFKVKTAMAAGIAQKAFDVVSSKGMLVIAGAGNKNENVDRRSGFLDNEKLAYFPCEAGGVLCVSGLSHDSVNRAGISNYGPQDVDLFAPGSNVAGLLPEGRGTEEVYGTSGAAAFVSGVAALVKAANRNLSAAQLRQVLIDTGKGSADETVHRIVQADAAVQRALAMNAPPGMQIVQPTKNASIPFSNSPVAEIGWSDGRTGATPPSVEWRVNGTFAGNGIVANLPSSAFPVGPATIEARATFIGGVVLSDTVSVTRQLPSSLKILQPAPGQALRPEDVLYRFRTDPVGDVLWSADGLAFARGGDMTTALPTLAPGRHTLTAVLSSGSDERRDQIDFTLLPAGLPQTTVTITSPVPQFIFDFNTPTGLAFTALDGTSPTTGTVIWRVIDATTGETYGSGTSTTGTVTIPRVTRVVLTVSVQKLLDLNNDGTPETSVIMASDARAYQVQLPPT